MRHGGSDGFGSFGGHDGFSHDGYPPSTQPPLSVMLKVPQNSGGRGEPGPVI